MDNFIKKSISRVAVLRTEIKNIVDIHKTYDVALSEAWVSVIAEKNHYISEIEDALVKVCKAPNIRNV